MFRSWLRSKSRPRTSREAGPPDSTVSVLWLGRCRLLRTLRVIALPLVLVAAAPTLVAQTTTGSATPNEEGGWDAYEYFSGSSSALGQVMKLDTSVGYTFNRYFGMDVGIPIYFVHASASSASSGFSSGTGVGNAYLDLRVIVRNPAVNYASVLTGMVPTGNENLGLSTGRFTFDWDNHFDRDFGSLRPFADLGIANTISDTHFFVRPFTTLGIVSHFEGGATYRVIPFVRLGASLYDDLPSGQQKIFSKLKGRQSAAGFAARRHAGPFENAHETVGPADIARDNGYSLWTESSSLPVVHLEAGYTRSVHYALNTFSFGVGFDVASLYHKVGGR